MVLKSTRKFIYDPVKFPKKARELGYDPKSMTEEQVAEVMNILCPNANVKVTNPKDEQTK